MSRPGSAVPGVGSSYFLFRRNTVWLLPTSRCGRLKHATCWPAPPLPGGHYRALTRVRRDRTLCELFTLVDAPGGYRLVGICAMSLNRRNLLRAAGAGAAAGPLVLAATAADAGTSPFRHGVASGDPLPDSVLLWTRVTPTDDALPGSGQGPAVTVAWQVARDPGFTRIAAGGQVQTG